MVMNKYLDVIITARRIKLQRSIDLAMQNKESDHVINKYRTRLTDLNTEVERLGKEDTRLNQNIC